MPTTLILLDAEELARLTSGGRVLAEVGGVEFLLGARDAAPARSLPAAPLETAAAGAALVDELLLVLRAIVPQTKGGEQRVVVDCMTQIDRLAPTTTRDQVGCIAAKWEAGARLNDEIPEYAAGLARAAAAVRRVLAAGVPAGGELVVKDSWQRLAEDALRALDAPVDSLRRNR